MNSLNGTLRVVAPHLSDELIAPAEREAVARAASWLPASLSQCIYLECRGTTAGVDLIVDVARGDMLAEQHRPSALSPALTELPEWQGAVALARAWFGTELSDRIDGMWLEFDLDRSDRSPPRPSVFVDFAPSVYREPSIERRVDTIVRAGSALGRPINSAMCQLLRRHVGALPRSALLLNAGFMLPRQTDAIRVCVMGMTAAELEDYFRNVAWGGHAEVALSLVRELAQLGEPYPAIIHLDIGHQDPSSLGLEYPFARHPQLASTIREGGVLEHLVARSYLTSARRAALPLWMGHQRCVLPHELWPSILVRRLNHIKLVVRPDASVETKLYLAVQHAALRSRRRSAIPK